MPGRLIDADALWEELDESSWYDNADRDEIALTIVDTAPTVDVELLVRCKDCKHAVPIKKEYIKKLFIEGTKECECGRGDLFFGCSIVSDDGFCEIGERKDDAE